MTCHENPTIIVLSTYSPSSFVIKTQPPRFRPNNATSVFCVNKLHKRKKKNNKPKQPILTYSVYFLVFLKCRISNRYLCFLSRSANSRRLSRHTHGGSGLYKLTREKPTGIHNRKNPFPCKPILLGLESKFPLKQLCILNAAGSLV